MDWKSFIITILHYYYLQYSIIIKSIAITSAYLIRNKYIKDQLEYIKLEVENRAI
jgi:hypothetical protein